ncbi:hypothetical protein NP493_415g01013 [Ridgeia piscesae]|uniref:CCHC-type domain-containing protein n=1 Tax=Ridgeia piscesae TaxID=27915 RepID=A0AAD9NVE4_RIDPI|nr:hypothetical protein NP493_415g01013 [Ridgeia piscesae]
MNIVIVSITFTRRSYCRYSIFIANENHFTALLVSFHIWKTWVHPECVGKDDKDIIAIWSCTSCRMLPTLVERLLEKTALLESLVVKLERSNQQLVSLMDKQSQEIRGLREDIATSKRPDGDADANDGRPQAVTLLVVYAWKNIAPLQRKAKTLTPIFTVSSVLPSKRRANPDRRADVNMKVKEACNEVDVKFVDNGATFTFRNGDGDDTTFQRDGLHLSESGVGRLLLNLSLPEQPPKHYKRQHQQQHQHVSNATNRDRSPNARVAPDSKWIVVKHRARQVMGKCAKCGGTNHVTATCKHPDKVLCRQCGERGHKEKNHTCDYEMGLNFPRQEHANREL